MHSSKRVLDLYQYLHTIPEVGWNESKTAAFLAEELKNAGYDVQKEVAKTGVIGILKGKNPGPVLGLRADMDALPYLVDGNLCARHTCGHDAHCAMVLAAAIDTAERGIDRGVLKIIFQPSEEQDDGALGVIKEGVIDNLDYLFAMHIRPVQELRHRQATPSLYHGSCYMLTAEIEGLKSHAGRPHLGINTVDAAVLATNAINTIHMDPSIQNSVKVTKIHAGGDALNSIPDRAEMAIDIRAQTNAIMKKLIEKTIKAIEVSAQAIDAQAKTKIISGVPAAEVAEEAVELAKAAIIQVLGNEGLVNSVYSPGGDDFHYYIHHNPTLKATYIGLGCDAEPGLHHPDMQFKLDALNDGMSIYQYLIKHILG